MSRILLADDSSNAQRMGERILREEGFEVVTVTDGETALIRLADVDPDVVLADAFLPQKSGFDLCWYIKNREEFRHTRVVLLAGLLERIDKGEAERVKADAILEKPFEASIVVATVRPLAEAAALARQTLREQRNGQQRTEAAAEPKAEAVTDPPPAAPPTEAKIETVADPPPAAPAAAKMEAVADPPPAAPAEAKPDTAVEMKPATVVDPAAAPVPVAVDAAPPALAELKAEAMLEPKPPAPAEPRAEAAAEIAPPEPAKPKAKAVLDLAPPAETKPAQPTKEPVVELAPPAPAEPKATVETTAASNGPAAKATQAPAPLADPDRERVRAAVTIALDHAMPALIEELTDRVMAALGRR